MILKILISSIENRFFFSLEQMNKINQQEFLIIEILWSIKQVQLHVDVGRTERIRVRIKKRKYNGNKVKQRNKKS